MSTVPNISDQRSILLALLINVALSKRPLESSIHSNGDVIFVVGAIKRRIRVYSTIVRMNSTIFDEILDRHFIKSQDRVKNYPIEIPLPDDDPDAMSIIFSIIHGRNDLVPTVPSAIQILNVAIICDRYKITNALKCAAWQWLHQDTCIHSDCLWRLSIAAYLFNDGEHFRILTLRLIFNHNGSYLTLMRTHEKSIKVDVLAEACYMLEECRTKLRMKIYTKVIEVLLYHNTDCYCNWHDQYVPSGLQFLNSKLWPGDIGQMSVSDIISIAKAIPEPKPHFSSETGCSLTDHQPPNSKAISESELDFRYDFEENCYTIDHQPPNSEGTIEEYIDNLMAIQEGLCLFCLQTNQIQTYICKHESKDVKYQ